MVAKTHKVAIVGVGKIARDQHVPAIERSQAFELAATASRNAEISGTRAYRTLAELLDAEPGITCISLCTPPQARYADARLALEAGRHVMLEKPPGATLSEVHDLVELARSKNVSLYATWHSRHAAAVDAARDWLADRRIDAIRINWKEDVRHWHPGQEWIWEAGGVGVFDPGINGLSVLTEILPFAIHVARAELSFPENRDTPIAASLHFRAPTDIPITAEFDWLEVGSPLWDIEIDTDGGAMLLREGGARLLIDGKEKASGGDAEYPRLYARFAELIPTGAIDVDLAPMRHVADAFTLGKRVTVPPFHW